jgi:hypothetical protein
MPTTKLGAGQQVETLNQAELHHELTKQTTAYFQEQARGFTSARFGPVAVTVSGGSVTVPGADATRFGPDQGWAWAVQRISADGLAANDVLKVYLNGTIYVGQITAAANFAPGSKGCVLRGGDFLVVKGSSLTATGDIVVNGEAAQAAELDIYKLL